jgi:hypothetical protein
VSRGARRGLNNAAAAWTPNESECFPMFGVWLGVRIRHTTIQSRHHHFFLSSSRKGRRRWTDDLWCRASLISPTSLPIFGVWLGVCISHTTIDSRRHNLFLSSSHSSFPHKLPSMYTHPTILASPWCIHRTGLAEILMGNIREIFEWHVLYVPYKITFDVLRIQLSWFFGLSVCDTSPPLCRKGHGAA